MKWYKAIAASVLIGVSSLCLLASGCHERREKTVVVRDRGSHKRYVREERKPKKVVIKVKKDHPTKKHHIKKDHPKEHEIKEKKHHDD